MDSRYLYTIRGLLTFLLWAESIRHPPKLMGAESSIDLVGRYPPLVRLSALANSELVNEPLRYPVVSGQQGATIRDP